MPARASTYPGTPNSFVRKSLKLMHGSVARLARVAKACRRRGRSTEDAEDLIQDALLRLEEFRHKGKGANPIKNPEAWLATTIRNRSIDQYRRESLLALAPQSLEQLDELDLVVDPSPGPERIVDGRQRLEEIKRTLDAVSARMREMYLLSIAGYTHVEVAKTFGVSLATVERELSRAVLTLMERWAQE